MRAGNARAAPVVVRAAVELYGEDVAPCTKTVKAAHETHAAKNLSLKTALRDIPAPPARGRRQHFPAEGMSALRAFVKMLRLAKLPVFRETEISEEFTAQSRVELSDAVRRLSRDELGSAAM